MNQYLILERVSVQNANAIAGFTWGFPAITNFLGFTHALSRKLEVISGVRLTGCGVASHEYQVHTYQPYSDFEFIQQKCPAKGKKVVNPPIIEEGKMNLTVSLIIAVDNKNAFSGDKAEEIQFEQKIKNLCYQQKLAGGTILNIQSVKFYSDNKKNKKALNKIKRKLMPSFVLLDCSDDLKNHAIRQQKDSPDNELLDVWLDFSALKQKANPILKEKQKITAKTKANWEPQSKPINGWIVPIMTGYKSISDIYKAGEVENIRDETVSSCFVEAIHSVGEWKGLYRLQQLSECIWEYQYKDGWYMCKQQNDISRSEEEQPLISGLNEFFENFLGE